MAHLELGSWPAPAAVSGLSRRNRRAGAYEAYVPDRVAGRGFLLRGEDLADAADAERAIVTLDRAKASLADTEAIARLLLRAESVASSRIEGLAVGPRRLLAAEIRNRAGEPSDDVTADEVLANIDAMTFALASLRADTQITPALVLAVHRRLVAPSLGDRGGLVRTEQNWIGGSPYNPIGADFVPPPPELVPALLDDLCSFCNEDALPAVAQAAIAHAQFETIHPFIDGNGRVGRALVQMILRRRAITTAVIPPVSLVLARNARAYVAGLTGTRYVGAPDSAAAVEGISRWVGIFASASMRAVAEAEEYERSIASIRETWRAKLGPVRSDSAVLAILANLPGAPVTTVAAISGMLGKSTPTAMKAIARLVEAGILHPVREQRRRRQIYEARDVVKAFTALEERLASGSP